MQVAIEDTRFDHGEAVVRVDSHDPVHPLQTHHHATVHRHCGAGGVAATAAADHRYAMCAASLHQRHDLAVFSRERHGVGQGAAARVVVGVGNPLGFAEGEGLGRERVVQASQ